MHPITDPILRFWLSHTPNTISRSSGGIVVVGWHCSGGVLLSGRSVEQRRRQLRECWRASSATEFDSERRQRRREVPTDSDDSHPQQPDHPALDICRRITQTLQPLLNDGDVVEAVVCGKGYK
ncbi:hypothetical protein VNO80_30453 [Phaseolus coccineus]|uniref:Uncharacterized protein n=1 Tax=Phaseolus coccineus TaxID=3886 RepID=A0AAN9LD89_PHACN